MINPAPINPASINPAPINPASRDRGVPLAGHRVLVCRQPIDAEPLLALLAEMGAAPLVMPLQRAATPHDGAAGLGRALGRLDQYDWLVVTSANAVAALVAHGVRGPAKGSLRTAAVGPATARAMLQADFVIDVVPAMATAADLAQAIAAAARGGGRVLAPLAEEAAPDLVDGLVAAGFEVDRVDAYRMEPVAPDADLLAWARGADVAVLTAPSVARRLVEVLGDALPTNVVAIGPRTATAARRLGFSVVIEAEATDPTALADAVALAVANR